MYDQSTLSEIIRFARVDAGCAVIDVYPGAGDWTRLFSDVVGPNGRVSSFVPTEIADLKHDQVGRIQTIANESGERTSMSCRRISWLSPRPRNQQMSCGCTCSTTISIPS